MLKEQDRQLHVLFLPSFYSDPDKPLIGSFFKDQALAVASMSQIRVGVAYVEPRSIRALRLRTLKQNHGQITSEYEDKLLTVRLHGWNPYLQSVVGGLAWSMATRFLVNHYIRRHGSPDLIHAHNALWAGYTAHHIHRHLRIPFVLTEHSGGFLTDEISMLSRAIARTTYQSASMLLTVSRALGDALNKVHHERRFQLLPNCVDTNFFSRSPRLLQNRQFVFLAVAQFSKNKGFDVLLNAFADALRTTSDIYLMIGGDGPIRSELIAQCEKLLISESVIFLGALTRENVRDAMARADAFILSSLHETFGIVLIEAMSMGLPVIATRCGGPEDIVTQSTGILVQPGDVRQLSEAITAMRNTLHFSSEAIRNTAREKYDRSVFSELLLAVYREALQSNSTPP